jgi:hypothetical protein
MKKYAVYVIMDYIQLLKHEAIPIAIKESLLNGIYALLDVCTEYEYPSSLKFHFSIKTKSKIIVMIWI